MRRLVVESLHARSFRNLASVDIELGARFNVIAGDNGQGKTNLLEAVYVLATSKSFRTSRPADLAMRGSPVASLRGVVREGDERREQTLGLRGGLRSVRVDERRPRTLAEYAVLTPTVVFHPAGLALASGPGAERRKLLDRISLYRSPMSLADAESYAKALRGRQRALELRGSDARDLDGWEELVVKHGIALGAARAASAELLAPLAEAAFARIGAPSISLSVRYAPSAPAEAGAFRDELLRLRIRDRARGTASVGPHRDDLALALSGEPVRTMASQGQQRAVVLALDLAEIGVIAEARGVVPVLLLDDVSSELDRARMLALLATLQSGDGQVLLTTTRPELFDFALLDGSSTASDVRHFRVERGVVSVVPRAG
jgi:DNA replication and repair protein RecF